jgi:ClpP class serine protease
VVNPLFYLAGFLAFAVLLALGMNLWGRLRHKREQKKAITARATRARMTYNDYAKEYAKAFAALENKGYCVLDVIHDLSDEWQAKDGARQFISYEEAFFLCEKIRRNKKSPLLLVLHTLGGYSFPSEMIANAIKKHPGKKFACVPYVAMSGGTVIALATDLIHMGKDAFLGPIDTQYAGFPAEAFDKLKEDKSKERIGDSVLLTSYLVDQHKKTAKSRAMAILNDRHQPKDDKEHVVNELMSAGRHHAEPISASEAKKIKINVDTAIPPEVNTLVDARLGMLRTYPQQHPMPAPADPVPETVFANSFKEPAPLPEPDMRFIAANDQAVSAP